MEAAGEKLLSELRTVVTAAEELLSATGSESAERLKELRGRAEEALRGARARLEGAGDEIEDRVRRHPFAALGMAAAVGLVIGVLLDAQMSTGLLESARNFVAGLLDLGRTRFELFGTELREELARLATAVIGWLAVLVLVALGLGFAALALVLHADPENRLAATVGVAVFFLVAAGIVAWLLRRLAEAKPRAFDATISELQRDLNTIRQ